MVSNHFSETRNLEVTPVVVEYEGVPISYQHQMWRVRPESVCANYKQKISQFFECTTKALRLFNVLCSELKGTGSINWRQAKFQTMYFNEAKSLKPTVANMCAAP